MEIKKFYQLALIFLNSLASTAFLQAQGKETMCSNIAFVYSFVMAIILVSGMLFSDKTDKGDNSIIEYLTFASLCALIATTGAAGHIITGVAMTFSLLIILSRNRIA